ncbi:hypothetical protein [Nocardia thraciensis]
MKPRDTKGPRRDRWITERPWELEYFDPERWRPRELWRRCGLWIGATRRRRWTAWTLVIFFFVVVFPFAVGSVAIAASGSDTAPANGLGFLEVKDSSGVDVSQYTFATNHGSILNPGDTFVSSFIVILFAGWLFIAQVLVWLVGKGIDLSWLDTFRQPLLGAAQSFADQMGTLAVSFTAAAIGALFIAYFLVRGFVAKAVRQIVALLLAATFSGFFLTNPMAHELSKDGWLAQGRDVGLSVAAGLNGNSNPNPNALVPALQASMADNFIRKPLQVWNFGHVVDMRPECKAMWSTATSVGDEDQIKEGMKTCGDYGAYKSADNPRAAQIAIGFLMIFVQLVLCVGFGFMISNLTRAVLAIFIHGFMIIFGFAAGAYIYGPSQTFLVTNVVSTGFAVLRFMGYCAGTGVVLLISDNLLSQAGGNVLAVLVLWPFFMIVGVVEFRHLRDSMGRGSDWVANRTALAIQGAGEGVGGGGAGAGGVGGRALGMGMGMGETAAGTNHFKMMAAMAGANTISNFAPLEWLVGGIPGFGHPQSKMKRDQARAQKAAWSDPLYGGKRGTYRISNMNWHAFSVGAREKGIKAGGLDTWRGAAGALQGHLDSGGFPQGFLGAYIGAGGNAERKAHMVGRDQGVVERLIADEPFKNKHLSRLAASIRNAHDLSNDYLNGDVDAERVMAAYGTLNQSVEMYRDSHKGGGQIHLDPLHERLAKDYVYNRDESLESKIHFVEALNDVAHLGDAAYANYKPPKEDEKGQPNRWYQILQDHGVESKDADRMRRWITNEHALDVQRVKNRFFDDVTDQKRFRKLRNSAYESIRTYNRMWGDAGPSLSVTPSTGGSHWRDVEWSEKMAAVRDGFD